MASSITLYDSDGNPQVFTGDMIRGVATAWASVSETQVVNDNLNIASAVEVSTGFVKVTFDTPMDNTNYSVIAIINDATVDLLAYTASVESRTLNDFVVRMVWSTNGVAAETYGFSVQVFGGKS